MYTQAYNSDTLVGVLGPRSLPLVGTFLLQVLQSLSHLISEDLETSVHCILLILLNGIK